MKGKKQARGKWNFLVMRSQGEVTNFSVSPFFLALTFLFALFFAVVSIVVMNQYVKLYLEHQEMLEDGREALIRRDQLDKERQYHVALTHDYAKLLAELDPSGPESDIDPDDSQEGAAKTTGATNIFAEEEDPLSAWAASLPPLTEGSGKNLNVVDFKAEGDQFSFQLVNEAAGTQARGRLLALFLVESGGRNQVVPFPDFDLGVPQLNFESGAAYNIRSSKQISGQLEIPLGSKILAAVVAARSSDGRMVMKKLVQP